jgi:uncharacterized protein (DUF2147 family)
MTKKISICLVIALFSLLGLTAVAQTAAPALTPAQQAVVGMWDEQNGGGILELYVKDGVLYGKIVHTSNKLNNNGVCKNCDGSRKNQPYVGMNIMYGFKPEGATEVWSGGTIVDVANAGRLISAKIKAQNGGAELNLRGYIGSPILGETKIWKRIK